MHGKGFRHDDRCRLDCRRHLLFDQSILILRHHNPQDAGQPRARSGYLDPSIVSMLDNGRKYLVLNPRRQLLVYRCSPLRRLLFVFGSGAPSPTSSGINSRTL
jgi:hypothetical protein